MESSERPDEDGSAEATDSGRHRGGSEDEEGTRQEPRARANAEANTANHPPCDRQSTKALAMDTDTGDTASLTEAQAGENAPLPGVMLPPSAPAQPSSGGCSGTAHDEHEAGAGPSTGRRSPSRKRKKSEGEDDVDDASADGAPRRPMTRARKAASNTTDKSTDNSSSKKPPKRTSRPKRKGPRS